MAETPKFVKRTWTEFGWYWDKYETIVPYTGDKYEDTEKTCRRIEEEKIKAIDSNKECQECQEERWTFVDENGNEVNGDCIYNEED